MSVEKERWVCPNCGTPLNIASLGIYAKVACPACGHVDHVHTMLANFRLEGVLGLGGMSVVLRARDLVLDRPLAVKLLNEFYRDQPERIARFEQECSLMAKVRHENVVSVYSAGHAKGQFYIAMELVNGRNLEEVVQTDGAMEPMRVLDVLRQVALGLEAAHKAGLLHRDMKPGNILICEDGHAKVLDFGLALGLRDADTEEIIWATPYYVPPETLRGEPEDLRTDIYALGMTLRHLLTGKHEFASAPVGIDDMLVCKQNLPSMAEEMPELPEEYCELIDHMTAYAPADRPDDYASLLAEVEEVWAAMQEEHAAVDSTERLKRCLPYLAGLVATLVLGGGAAAFAKHVSTPEPEVLYHTSGTELDWYERDQLAEAMATLQAGQLQEATTILSELAQVEGEPTACAWASLHAWVLECLREQEAEVAAFRGLLETHLSRTPAPAGREMHEQMAALLNTDSAPEDKFLQAAASLMRFRQARDQGQRGEEHLRAARSALAGAGQAYAPLLEQVDALAEKAAAPVAPVEEKPVELTPQQRYAQTVMRLDMKQAPDDLQQFLPIHGSVHDRKCWNVQREALLLLKDAVELLERHSLKPAAGELVSPERLRKLVSALGQPNLPEELETLMLVALGEFDKAAAKNPYANDPESAECFAIIMRGWFDFMK